MTEAPRYCMYQCNVCREYQPTARPCYTLMQFPFQPGQCVQNETVNPPARWIPVDPKDAEKALQGIQIVKDVYWEDPEED